jgi:O-acetyl-ADP-ribose deacetylase (regulator of RNase III)
MSKLIYKTGDLFKSAIKNKLIVHVANHIGAMGGFAGALDQRFGLECADYKVECNRIKNFYSRTFFTPINKGNTVFKNSHIAHMICQHQMHGPSERNIKYPNLVKCMEEVVDYYHENALTGGIICPKFGSFLGGCNWDFIEELINDIWLDNNINVTVFTL